MFVQVLGFGGTFVFDVVEAVEFRVPEYTLNAVLN